VLKNTRIEQAVQNHEDRTAPGDQSRELLMDSVFMPEQRIAAIYPYLFQPPVL
jgi:hypothetical protein